MEDAIVLARCVEGSTDIAAALLRYEAARLDRTSRIVLRSAENLPLLMNPKLAVPNQATALMDLEYAPGRVAARYDWLYEYNAMTVFI
jgi:salicylate hydroxylase